MRQTQVTLQVFYSWITVTVLEFLKSTAERAAREEQMLEKKINLDYQEKGKRKCRRKERTKRTKKNQGFNRCEGSYPRRTEIPRRNCTGGFYNILRTVDSFCDVVVLEEGMRQCLTCH